jgi:hypothetical protein
LIAKKSIDREKFVLLIFHICIRRLTPSLTCLIDGRQTRLHMPKTTSHGLPYSSLNHPAFNMSVVNLYEFNICGFGKPTQFLYPHKGVQIHRIQSTFNTLIVTEQYHAMWVVNTYDRNIYFLACLFVFNLCIKKFLVVGFEWDTLWFEIRLPQADPHSVVLVYRPSYNQFLQM